MKYFISILISFLFVISCKHDVNEVVAPDATIYYWFGSHIGDLPPVVNELVNIWWSVSKPDVFISFGESKRSDKMKSTVYHEMTHVAQYAETGAIWWDQYVRYIIQIDLTNLPKPYGNNTYPGHGRAELTEGMAYAFENVSTDAEYGLNHSNGGFNAQTLRYLNNVEQLKFYNPSDQFIPSGLFFDLYDKNGVFPDEVSASEASGIIDNAFGFPFETQIQVYSQPNFYGVGEFKNYLWQFHGSVSGSTLNNFNQLFESFGH